MGSSIGLCFWFFVTDKIGSYRYCGYDNVTNVSNVNKTSNIADMANASNGLT